MQHVLKLHSKCFCPTLHV